MKSSESLFNSPAPQLPNSSAPQLPNSPAPQLPNSPTPQHPNSSAPQPPNSPTPQHPNSSAPQHPNSPTPQHPNSSAPQHPNSPAPQLPSTPTPQLLNSPAPQLPSSSTPQLPSYYKHESAYVDEPVSIGAGTKIWHFSHVLSGAKIGEKCVLGQNVQIANDVIIGNNVKIQNNVSVYTGTVLEDDVFLGPSCVLTNVTNPRSQVNRHSLYEKTLLRRGATVGANATIVCGTTIGRYAFIAAGAVVTKDVPDYALIMGNPGRQNGWMSRHGHRLNFSETGEAVCPESGYRYQLENDRVRCLDLDEDQPLPDNLSSGSSAYDSFK